MTRWLALFVAIGASVAHADPEHPEDPQELGRKFYEAGDFVHAREQLLIAYKLEPRSELLFALGQVEFNLHHYQAAIDYYEQFNATNPEAAQAALAQQAIGAARIELRRPPPPPPPPKRLPPHHHWEIEDSGLLAFGGLAGAVGGGVLYYSHHLSKNHMGTLGMYDQRIAAARTARNAAFGCFAAGVIAIGAALVHYKLHLVETTVEIHPAEGGAAVSFERVW